ncbi:MAG: efflux RND transporter periplasmic adaptor subunit [Coleofasciculus sp. A1-SPW-01]|uniref:HlyD family secretion protein n=1 Tax=Coleofasciculus sp. A1-SPW-01 TaxID=3070819 RepID=UPI0032F2AEF7
MTPQPLKLVPPTSNSQPTLNTPKQRAFKSHKTHPHQKIPYKRFLFLSGIGITLGLISQIPISNTVQAEAQLEPLPNSHQIIYAEISGTITELFVQPNQPINSGQPIAMISTDDLSRDIANTQAKLAETQSSFKSASIQLTPLKSQLHEAQTKEASLRRQLQQQRQELAKITGNTAPEINRLSQQILALQSTINGLHHQINGDKTNLTILEEKINTYQSLVEAGVIAKTQVNDLQMKAESLKANIGFKESEVQEYQRQIAAKQAEIDIIVKQKQDDLKQGEDQLKTLVTERQTAALALEAAEVSVASQVPLLNTLQTELNRQQQKQETHQVIQAKVSGFVISQDFQKLLGKKMQPGEPILEIADLGKLVAIIEVNQADSDVVQEGAAVTFHPLEPGFSAYQTRIMKRDLVMQPDVSGQRQLLQVRAVIENPDYKLVPGAKVYAEIESERLLLYEKVWRELVKVFQVCKYGVC